MKLGIGALVACLCILSQSAHAIDHGFERFDAPVGAAPFTPVTPAATVAPITPAQPVPRDVWGAPGPSVPSHAGPISTVPPSTKGKREEKADDDKADERLTRLEKLKKGRTGDDIRKQYVKRYDALLTELEKFKDDLKELKANGKWPAKGKFPFEELEKALHGMYLSLEVGEDAKERKDIDGFNKDQIENKVRWVGMLERIAIMDFQFLLATYGRGLIYRLKEQIDNGGFRKEQLTDETYVKKYREVALTAGKHWYKNTTYQVKDVQDMMDATPMADDLRKHVAQILNGPHEKTRETKTLSGFDTQPLLDIHAKQANRNYDAKKITEWEALLKEKKKK